MVVYVVMASRGEYSDYTENTICVCQQEATATRLVNDLEELQAFDNAFAKRTREEFEEQYKHETPMLPSPEKPAMSAELRSLMPCKKEGGIKALFHNLHDEYMRRIQAWHKECVEVNKQHSDLHWKQETAKKDWIATNYNSPAHLQEAIRLMGREISSFRGYDVANYSHYEAEFIEN